MPWPSPFLGRLEILFAWANMVTLRILIDTNREPENFLKTNAFYDSKIVGKCPTLVVEDWSSWEIEGGSLKIIVRAERLQQHFNSRYCEDRDPHLAYTARDLYIWKVIPPFIWYTVYIYIYIYKYAIHCLSCCSGLWHLFLGTQGLCSSSVPKEAVPRPTNVPGDPAMRRQQILASCSMIGIFESSYCCKLSCAWIKRQFFSEFLHVLCPSIGHLDSWTSCALLLSNWWTSPTATASSDCKQGHGLRCVV